MKVSVITVCKNSQETIEKTVKSVLNQKYKAIEYILIDGLSSDATLAVIKPYRESISRVISEKDSGIYEAMNKGLHIASGDWIYFLNADDHLFDDRVIEDVVSFIHQNPSIDLVYGDHQAQFQNGSTVLSQPTTPDQMLDEIICLGDKQLLQPATFFKKSVFRETQYFNENLKIAGDYEWFLKIFSNPIIKKAYLPRIIVSYKHGGASANIHQLFQEIFAIQLQSEICQTYEKLQKRIQALEKLYLEQYEQANDLRKENHALLRSNILGWAFWKVMIFLRGKLRA